MSAAKYIKLAIIAALVEHPDADKYRQRAFSLGALDDLMAALAQQGQTLTKADFFVPDDDGKFIIDSDAAWKNFDRIAKALEASGQSLTFEDFTAPLPMNRTLLDCAAAHRGLNKVFSADLWKGRFDEMERLWYRLPVPLRKELFGNQGLLSPALKRQIYAAEGKTTPEDRLAKAGLTPADVREAFVSQAGFESLCAKLEKAGDYLRKEYIMMPDPFGDTVFDNRLAAWGRYDACVAIMAAHGERFENADFLKQASYAKHILGRAAEQKMLDKIFKPAHWVGRLPEMTELWSNVKDGWKTAPLTARDFDAAFAEAESLTYTQLFLGRKVTGKADLLAPLNGGAAGDKPVLPLSLKSFWDSYDLIEKQLAARGEALTIADLRLESGQMGGSCLMNAAKMGCFDKVIRISKSGGGNITLDDFMAADRHGVTLINVLAERKQLALAFSTDIWAGRIAEMRALWLQVNTAYRPQVDFQQLLVEAKQATLKKKMGPGIKFNPKP